VCCEVIAPSAAFNIVSSVMCVCVIVLVISFY